MEVRATNTYVCGTDTIIGTAPTVCVNTGLPPKQLLVQRVYRKEQDKMVYYERKAGSMTYHLTHGHMHVDDWGIYTLRKSTSNPDPLTWPIITQGTKLAFCLMDYGEMKRRRLARELELSKQQRGKYDRSIGMAHARASR